MGKHKPSRFDNRKVRATVKLAAPVCNLLEFKLDVTPSTKINYIIERIIEQHGGSIRELSVCVNRFHPEEIVNANASSDQAFSDRHAQGARDCEAGGAGVQPLRTERRG